MLIKSYERDYIFGVTKNNLSFAIKSLEITDAQTPYDYICNVSSTSYNRGNGSWSISIVNKNFESGIKIHDWDLEDGYIWFDWGESKVSVTLRDSSGEIIRDLITVINKGATRGFQVESLIKGMFSFLTNFVITYPSIAIYRAYSALNDTRKSLMSSNLRKFTGCADLQSFTKTFYESTLSPLYNYFAKYREFIALLDSSNDSRCTRLKTYVTDDCRKTIELLEIPRMESIS